VRFTGTSDDAVVRCEQREGYVRSTKLG